MVSEKVCVETFGGGGCFLFFCCFFAVSFSSKKMGGRLSWACFFFFFCFFVFLLSLAKLALILGTFIFGSPTFHFSAGIGQLKLHPWRFQGNRSVGEILTKWPDCIKAHQNKLHELTGA